MEANESRTERAARYVRYGLMVAIAAMVALILLEVPWHSEQRFRVRSAYGDFGAAPGMIAISIGGASAGGAGGVDNSAGTSNNPGSGGAGASRFYIIDTSKNVICIYTMTGEKIRLVNARKYDYDTDIVDASLDVPLVDRSGVIPSFEGKNGLTRPEAKAYAEGLKKMMEAGQAKRP